MICATGRKPLLEAGAIVNIQGNNYHVSEPLGMGSFGAVWAAERRDGVKGEVAVKEILCRSQKELGDATLEGRLLRLIHSTRPQQLVGKVPDLVGCEAEPLGPDQWLMRLAMTKVPGMQLDTFLEMRHLPSARGSVDSSAVANAVAVTVSQCQSLAGVCRFSRSLLSQLASIFECMAPVVYHRDVSPHNILIDVESSNNPRFGLVDFGLGIDLQSWHGQKGPSSWHYVDIGGDCRYWPVSVWIMFVGGSDELDKLPHLSKEYQTRLDFHALGITVLEILMSLLPASAFAIDEIWSLQAAWNQYWKDVTRFWKRTMEVFDSGQDPVHLKQWIRTEGRVVDTLGADLLSLRSALRRAADACASALPGSAICVPDAARIFRTLLELLSNGGKSGMLDSLETPRWQTIRYLIDADSVPVASSLSSMSAGSMVAMAGPKTSIGQGFTYPGSMVVPSGTKMQEWKRSCSTMALGPRSASPIGTQYAHVRVVR